MNKLSKRLEAIIDFVPKESIVADIGSDHGSIPIALINRDIVTKAFANENKKGPYSKLVTNIEKSCLKPNLIETSLSDGLSELPNYVNTVVIAGMGGDLISSIINDNKDKIQNISTFIIDAHNDLSLVIDTMMELGYVMTDDICLKERKTFYLIAKFEKTNKKIEYNEIQKKFGPIEIKRKSPEFVNYLNSELERYNYILSLNIDDQKAREIKGEIQLIQEALN